MSISRTLLTAAALSWLLLPGLAAAAPLPASLLGNWSGSDRIIHAFSLGDYQEGYSDYEQTKVSWRKTGSSFVRTEVMFSRSGIPGYTYPVEGPKTVTTMTFDANGRFRFIQKGVPENFYSGTWSFSKHVLKLNSTGPWEPKATAVIHFRQQFMVHGAQIIGKTFNSTLNPRTGRTFKMVTFATDTKVK